VYQPLRRPVRGERDDASQTRAPRALSLLTCRPCTTRAKLSRGNPWRPMAYSPAKNPDYQEAEMAYERLDEALRQLKTDLERKEATEKQQKKAGEEAGMRFAQIKSVVIGPIFNEVVAHLVAEGFFGETVDEQSDGSGSISLNVNLSEDEGFSRQGTLQVRFDLDKYGCEFGKSTMANTSATNQLVFDDEHYKLDEMTMELVREKAEQFVLDLIQNG
jgi:hypothetical protein